MIIDSSCCLALDIGGTKFEMGLFDLRGSMIGESRRFPVSFEAHNQADVEEMINLMRTFFNETPHEGKILSGIGVSICGRVEEKEGIVVLAPNLNWKRVKLREILGNAFSLPIHVAVDTKQAATAEKMWGAARDSENFAWVTLGTGCGSYYFLNGKPFDGARGFAGEIGHITFDEVNGYPCGCGKRGCLETLVAGPAIARQGQAIFDRGESRIIRELAGEKPVTPETVVRAMEMGDPSAAQIINTVMRIFSMSLGGLVNALDLEMIVLGGGIVHSITGFIEHIQLQIRDYLIFEETRRELRVVKESFHNSALIGAAANFFIKEGIHV